MSRFLSARVATLTTLLALHGLSLPLAHMHWLADLAASFAAHALVLALICALVMGSLRRSAWMTLALVVAGANASVIVRSGAAGIPPRGPAATAPGATHVTIAQWNVHSGNSRRREVVEWLLARHAELDIVILLEITPAWGRDIERLRKHYAAAWVEPRSDNFGIAVLSRPPGSTIEPVRAGVLALPSAIVEIPASRGHERLQIAATHPIPPLGRDASDARDDQIRLLARRLAAGPGEAALVGDFNATPWSPALAGAARAARLRTARRGVALPPTWAPAGLPSWLGLPLDFLLISPGLTVTAMEAGPRLGSDHASVVTRLAVTAGGSTER